MNTSELEKLGGQAFDAAHRYRMMGAQNTAIPYEEARKQAIEYAKAAAECREARKALDDYLDAIRS